jgi:HlyD family type I secretion membrane fusion protein
VNATLSPLAGPMRLGVGAIVVALLALMAWSAMAPLSGAVVTRGLVRSELHRKAVQHPEGGAVRVIHVREGDRVQEGQVLLELEGVGSDANLQLLRELHLFESLRHSRLEAEQVLADDFEPAAALSPVVELPDGRYQQAVARETGIFKARREAMDQQLHTLAEQIRSLDTEQQALRRQATAAEEGLRLAQAEADMSRHLQSQQFVSRARLLADERAVADYRARMGEFEAQLAQSAQRVNDVRLRMAVLRHTYQRQASEELRESAARLAELRERLRPVESAVQRLQVRAPADGRVVGLRLSGPGQVVGPRDVIMQIVPEDEALLLEAAVDVDHILELQVGQKADLRFTAAHARSTPLVSGEVVHLSADALTDREGVPRFQVHIRPDLSRLQQAGLPALQPGMAAEVFIVTRPRTPLDYLLEPLTDALRQSMRER